MARKVAIIWLEKRGKVECPQGFSAASEGNWKCQHTYNLYLNKEYKAHLLEPLEINSAIDDDRKADAMSRSFNSFHYSVICQE